MSRTDLIADAFCIIRNAIMAKRENADIPASKMLLAILELLKGNGYIDNYKLIADKKQGILRVYLKYSAGKPAISNLKRVSRPGLRIYKKSSEIPVVLRGRGLAIVSSPKGLITDTQAREMKAGGEVIAYVW